MFGNFYTRLAAETFLKVNLEMLGTGIVVGRVFAFLAFTNSALKFGIQIIFGKNRTGRLYKERRYDNYWR